MALSASTVWEVRTTGSDSNGGSFVSGGSGTDRSQQDAAYANGTNLVVDSVTNTDVAPDGYTPASTDVDNHIQITTTGTGAAFTTGFYRIVSIQSGKWRLDRSPAATSSAGATWALGGALASPGMASKAIVDAAVDDMTVHVKSGTYNCSSTANVSGGRPQPNRRCRWVGYNSTRGDLSTVAGLWSANMPSFKATSNSMTIFAAASNDANCENIEVDGDSANRTSVAGFNPTTGFRVTVRNCRAKGCTARGFGLNGAWCLWFCEAVSTSGSEGFRIVGLAVGCIARSGVSSSTGFTTQGAGTMFIGCASYSNTSNGFGNIFALNCVGCVSVSNGGVGFDLDSYGATLHNCIAYGNTGIGYSTATAAIAATALLFNCAGGSNSANFNSTQIPTANRINFVTLTADPFVDRTNRNFALNTTAGGGAALRGLGMGTFPGSATTGYPDIGVAQHQESASGGRRPVLRGSYV